MPAATLAGAALSTALFFIFLSKGAALDRYLTANASSPAERTRDVLVAVAAAGLVGVVSFLLSLRRANGVAWIGRAAAYAAPAATLALWPPLLRASAFRPEPLVHVLLLAVAVVALERLSRPAFEELALAYPEWAAYVVTVHPRTRDRLALGIVAAVAFAFIVWGGYYTVLSHRRLATSSFDLGIYDNLMFNALHGHPFRSPVLFGPQGGNYIAGHAEFAMLLAVPLYALAPGSETLLWLQAFCLGGAAVPLYLFARTQIARSHAVVVAVAYLLFAPLHGPLFYDFHWLPLAILFHFLLYWAVEAKRYVASGIFLAILFAIREDVAVGTALYGVFLVVTRHRVTFGAVCTVASGIWFVVDKFVIMPAAGTWWFASIYKDLIPQGEAGYGAVVKTMIVNPVFFFQSLLKEDKLTYAAHLLGPLACLPVRRGTLWLLLIPGAFFTLMTTAYGPTVSISFQYTTHWIPYLFLASVLALRHLRTEGAARGSAAVLALGVGVLVHSIGYGAIFQHSHFYAGFGHIIFEMSPAEKAQHRDLVALARSIPLSASVAATDSLVPHISARATCYTLRDHYGGADYLLVHKAGLSFGGTRKNLEEAKRLSAFTLVSRKGDLFLLKKSTGERDDSVWEGIGL